MCPITAKLITGFEPFYERERRQRGILIRLAIAVVYDNRVQYSYSILSNLCWRRLRRKRQLVMHHVFNNLCLEYCTHCT